MVHGIFTIAVIVALCWLAARLAAQRSMLARATESAYFSAQDTNDFYQLWITITLSNLESRERRLNEMLATVPECPPPSPKPQSDFVFSIDADVYKLVEDWEKKKRT